MSVPPSPTCPCADLEGIVSPAPSVNSHKCSRFPVSIGILVMIPSIPPRSAPSEKKITNCLFFM